MELTGRQVHVTLGYLNKRSLADRMQLRADAFPLVVEGNMKFDAQACAYTARVFQSLTELTLWSGRFRGTYVYEHPTGKCSSATCVVAHEFKVLPT